MWGNKIKVGDRLLIKIMAFDCKHELFNRWEEDPWVIVPYPYPDTPVFVIKKKNGEGRQRALYKNLLRPVEILHSGDQVESKFQLQRSSSKEEENKLG